MQILSLGGWFVMELKSLLVDQSLLEVIFNKNTVCRPLQGSKFKHLPVPSQLAVVGSKKIVNSDDGLNENHLTWSFWSSDPDTLCETFMMEN